MESQHLRSGGSRLPVGGHSVFGLASELSGNGGACRFARIDSQIDFHWGAGSPGAGIRHNTFSMTWEGDIEAPYSETVTFTVRADDGVRLWVDDQLIIDAWKDQPATQHSGSIAMNAWHRVPIRLEYYQQNVYDGTWKPFRWRICLRAFISCVWEAATSRW